jgi:hypothetical protein
LSGVELWQPASKIARIAAGTERRGIKGYSIIADARTTAYYLLRTTCND